MTPHSRPPSGDFGAGYWEDRYRGGEGAGRHAPSPSLVSETGDLPPGQALDAGCGVGADAIWLAARGWHVTGVDVSGTALDRARDAARTAGRDLAGRDIAGRIDWVHGDLSAWTPGERRFGLVTSHYVHVPGPAEVLFQRLASWVAPGGTLLVVGHAHDGGHGDAPGQAGDRDRGRSHPGDQPHRDAGDHGHGTEGDHDRGGRHGLPGDRGDARDGRPAQGSQIRVDQVTSALPADRWEVLVARSGTRTVERAGADPLTLHDTVVRARRRGLPPAGCGLQPS